MQTCNYRVPHLGTFSKIISGLILCVALINGALADSKVTTWDQTSENGVFEVTLNPQTDESIEISEFLEWTVTVKTPDGEPVTPARITVDGGMPMHGHGLPSQPQVGEYLGEGKYLLKGLMFSMHGRWEILLDIQSRSLSDTVRFEIVLDY